MNGKQVRFKVVKSTLHFPGARHKIKEFQNLLNEDAVLTIAKKHPKRIKLTIEEGRLLVKLEKELREPKKIEVDGAKYVRSCTWGNKGAETLVRHNLEKMIIEAKAIGKKALAENSRELLYDLCLDPMSGMCRANFLDTQNNTMKGEQRGVFEVIKQFFKDTEFMRKLKREIKIEFQKEKAAASAGSQK